AGFWSWSGSTPGCRWAVMRRKAGRMGSSEPVAAVALADRWRPGPPPLLLAARCTACGEVSFPSRPWCPECWSETETEPLPPVGTLYTFTTVHVGDGAPRVLGYSDFGEVRV